MNHPETTAARPRFGLGPEYNSFLYAPLVEGPHGMPLSVLSALAQLELDPWDTAGQLTDLPRDTSVPLLASMLERLPACPPDRSARERLAAQLVELLPSRPRIAHTAGAADHTSGGESGPPGTWRARIRLVVAFMLFFLLTQAFMTGFATRRSGAPHPRDEASLGSSGAEHPPAGR